MSTPPSKLCALPFTSPSASFNHQPVHEITGAMPAVQLLGNDAVPGCTARTGGTRHTEHSCAIAESSKGAGLDRRRANFLKGQLTKQFAKTIDGGIKQRRNSNYSVVAFGEAGTAGKQDGMYLIICNQGRHQCPQLVYIVLADVLRAAEMSRSLQRIA